jgi:glycosyltransferase involved in cell wall biosynthesis
MRILFVYLGRRGAIPRFTLDLISAATQVKGIEPLVLLSSSNELASQFLKFPKGSVKFIDTFSNTAGVLLSPLRLSAARRTMRKVIADADLVVELMPHIWSSFLQGEKQNTEWWTIVHDARPHPGDITGLTHRILMRSCRLSNRLITLSDSVAGDLMNQGIATSDCLVKLFHPDLTFPRNGDLRLRTTAPLKFLFFGRILPYKGLDLFIEAISIAKSKGANIEAMVCGEGTLPMPQSKFHELGIELRNGWIPDGEIAEVLASCDVMVASHKEASQSGIIAAAFGAGMPVIATPVGGLREQVKQGETGRVTREVSAESIAAEILHFSKNFSEIVQLKKNILRQRDGRSMERFVSALLDRAKQHIGARTQN